VKSRRSARRTAFIVVAVLVVLMAGCSSGTPSGTAAPTATATTPASACASILPGAPLADLIEGFPFPLAYPPGSVATAAAQTSGGAPGFDIYTFEVCAPNTTPSAVQTYLDDRLPALDHGWLVSPYFPDGDGLMHSCAVPCWYDNKSRDKPLIAPPWYLVFDDFAAAGQSAVTYRGRYAAPPQFPSCLDNFASSPTPNFHYFLPEATLTVPVPPLTFMAPQDASGLHGYVLCSPGTVDSVVAFMRYALSATGWRLVSRDARCVYQDECWLQGSTGLSWDARDGGPGAWHIAWRTA
jgi:hypothetical protein